jgi:hypothetical protein
MKIPPVPENVKAWIRKYGVFVAIAAAIPGIAYFAVQPGPADKFRPLFFDELPGGAAVRAEAAGPPEAPSPPAPVPTVPHLSTPAFVKGIYVTAATAGYKAHFDELVDFVDRTELNTMVIDVKDGDGALAFNPTSDALKPYAAKHPELGNLADFTKPLHDKHIYLIARVFVFEDPWFAGKRPDLAVKNQAGKIWQDDKGVEWLDPAEKDVWSYDAEVAREAYAGGFDEVQFDYVRFLTDGSVSRAVFPAYDGKTPKADVIAAFFSYLDAELRVKAHIPISVDLFGLTMWAHDSDLNIGQKLDVAARHFDYVSPMVYPSHYPPGFMQYANPADYPYQIVFANMGKGQEVLDALHAENAADQKKNPPQGIAVAAFRPWLQDFNLGAVYTPDMVKAQMKAATDGHASGWIFWNARNVYTESAFAPAHGKPVSGMPPPSPVPDAKGSA